MEKIILEIWQNSLKPRYGDILEIKELGGMTNLNFLITTQKAQFVFRISGENSNLMIDRIREGRVLELLDSIQYKSIESKSQKSLANLCVFFESKSGVKITKFLQNAKTLNPSTIIGFLAQIANELKALHSADLSAILNLDSMKKELEFSPFCEMKKYLKIIENATSNSLNHAQTRESKKLQIIKSAEFQKSIEIFNKIENLAQKENWQEQNCLCHGDLVAENILVLPNSDSISNSDSIKSPQNSQNLQILQNPQEPQSPQEPTLTSNEPQIIFIDYEYAGLNHPLWDLASLFIESKLNTAQRAEFLRHYGKVDEAKLLAYEILVDILWGVWGVAKTTHKTDFLDYGAKRIELGLKNFGTFSKKFN